MLIIWSIERQRQRSMYRRPSAIISQRRSRRILYRVLSFSTLPAE
ncbi:hypothetical protein EVA_16318 [gut metagenome]|uniref:Uncharacterized protein n=1 Tax=gut metagenome TaxID=749906 RepID=J9FMC9_9ZZZZ